jgi:arylsulfatase A-like enzyme
VPDAVRRLPSDARRTSLKTIHRGVTVNVVLVLIDSLNRSALSAYGPTRVATPNLDAFARRGWRFDNHFVGSLPCMPARREIFAGIREVLWRPWGPLEPFDARLPRLLEERGYATAIVTDHYPTTGKRRRTATSSRSKGRS